MNPKRILLIILCLIAVVVWGRNILLIAKGNSGSEEGVKSSTVNNGILTASSYEYKADFRDPFFCKAFMSESQGGGTEKHHAGATAPAVKLPVCAVAGIVYNDNNSYMLFRIHGRSVVARQGDVIDSVRVDKISRDSVFVVYKGKTFALGK